MSGSPPSTGAGALGQFDTDLQTLVSKGIGDMPASDLMSGPMVKDGALLSAGITDLTGSMLVAALGANTDSISGGEAKWNAKSVNTLGAGATTSHKGGSAFGL